MTADELFAPPSADWQRLSPKYRTLRQLSSFFMLIPFGIAVVILVLVGVPWWIPTLVATVGVLSTIWRFIWAGREARSWAYAELEDDLWITHGLWFRSLTAVPYGRLQVVEVASGPIERSLGLATVTLVTASAQTDATIPGLPREDAARLRDHLSALGDAKASGL